MSYYDQNIKDYGVNNSGIGLTEQPPWMKNTTPNAQLASVGVARVQAAPGITPNHVRIPNNWLKNVK